MSQDSRKKLFDTYLETTYKHANIISPQQFQMASEAFDIDYQGIMPTDKGAEILDLGCGIGHFLYFLKQKGYEHFFGIDISLQQVEYCRKHITERVQAVDGFDFLNSKINQYDLIAAHDVFEHIPKDQTLPFLALIHQALKNKGTVILRVPNMSNPFGLDARYNDFTHDNGYTSKSLQQILGIAGFQDIRILGPRHVPIRSFRTFFRKILVKLLHAVLRLCFYIQDYSVPQNLDKNLVVVARK